MNHKDGNLNFGICSYNYGHVLIWQDLTMLLLPLREATQYTSFSSCGMKMLLCSTHIVVLSSIAGVLGARDNRIHTQNHCDRHALMAGDIFVAAIILCMYRPNHSTVGHFVRKVLRSRISHVRHCIEAVCFESLLFLGFRRRYDSTSWISAQWPIVDAWPMLSRHRRTLTHFCAFSV